MNIKILDISSYDLTNSNLPSSIGLLKYITHLYLQGNNLTKLPESIGNLRNLERLDLQGNRIKKLPDSIGNLRKLKDLDLSENELTELPDSIGNLRKLRDLNLQGNRIKKLPESIGNLINLKELDLSENDLTELPGSIGNLGNLRDLDLYHNPNLRIIPGTLNRSVLRITKNSSTIFGPIVPKPVQVQRKNVLLNTNRTDPISGYNFRVGNNAVYIGHNRYVTENSLLRLIKRTNTNTNITNIKTLYNLNPNENIAVNPFTTTTNLLYRRNLNFVKFIKPNTPNTLAKNLNKMKINKKRKTPNNRNTPKPTRKKASNAAQSRRTNVNNNR
jgi:Leucine-rich repeat (LRR) protein